MKEKAKQFAIEAHSNQIRKSNGKAMILNDSTIESAQYVLQKMRK